MEGSLRALESVASFNAIKAISGVYGLLVDDTELLNCIEALAVINAGIKGIAATSAGEVSSALRVHHANTRKRLIRLTGLGYIYNVGFLRPEVQRARAGRNPCAYALTKQGQEVIGAYMQKQEELIRLFRLGVFKAEAGKVKKGGRGK